MYKASAKREEAEKEIKQLLGTQDFSEQLEVKGMVANSGIISERNNKKSLQRRS